MRPQPIRWIQLCVAAALAAPTPLAVAESLLVDTRRTSTSTTVNQEQLDALPTSRTYREVVNMAAPSKENPKDSINWEALGGARANQPVPYMTDGVLESSPVLTQREWPGYARTANPVLFVANRFAA
ncbi:MAG: hypothetical protein Q8S13_08770, partial [Dehalococcoidia bacterium]|nr:hypothetical protein [Dehalococcoidia bacterium]